MARLRWPKAKLLAGLAELKSLGLTKREAARALGVSPSFITRYTYGEHGWAFGKRRPTNVKKILALVAARPELRTGREIGEALGISEDNVRVSLYQKGWTLKTIRGARAGRKGAGKQAGNGVL